jgi:hypothetical protein
MSIERVRGWLMKILGGFGSIVPISLGVVVKSARSVWLYDSMLLKDRIMRIRLISTQRQLPTISGTQNTVSWFVTLFIASFARALLLVISATGAHLLEGL